MKKMSSRRNSILLLTLGGVLLLARQGQGQSANAGPSNQPKNQATSGKSAKRKKAPTIKSVPQPTKEGEYSGSVAESGATRTIDPASQPISGISRDATSNSQLDIDFTDAVDADGNKIPGMYVIRNFGDRFQNRMIDGKPIHENMSVTTDQLFDLIQPDAAAGDDSTGGESRVHGRGPAGQLDRPKSE